LKRALNIQEQIEDLGKEMHQLLTGAELPAPIEGMIKARRKMSTAVRAKMAASQQARWAKRKGEKVEQPVKQGRRKMSAAARAKISAAAKARWAKVKVSGKSSL
jgi:hypothetical protein